MLYNFPMVSFWNVESSIQGHHPKNLSEAKKNTPMNRQRKGLLWTAIFVVLFVSSQDYLFMEWPEATGLLGFPIWLFWYFFVQILLVAAIWLFAKKFWQD